MKRLLLAALIALAPIHSNADIVSDLNSEISTQLPTNGAHAITAATLRTVLSDIVGRLQSFITSRSISVLDYGAKGDGVTADDAAFNAASAASVALGGVRVFVPGPQAGAFYKLNATWVVPQGVSVQCSEGAIIKAGATMTDLVKITATIGTRFAGCTLGTLTTGSPAVPLATNGINLAPAAVGNNSIIIEGQNTIVGFVNGIYNTNADIFTVRGNFLQNNSGWDIRSIDNGTGSLIDGNQSLGSGGGIYYSRQALPAGHNVEGVKIVNNNLLPTAGKGVKFDGGLKITIAHNVFDQLNDTAIEIDGDTGYPAADFTIDDNWGGTKTSPTANLTGLDMFGNVGDVRVTNSTFNGWACGIRMRTTPGGSIQRISIDGTRLVNNGTGAGSADLCTDTTAGGMGPIVVTKSWFESTGGSVKSIIEGAGTVGVYRDNRFYAGLTKSTTSYYDHNLGDDTDPSTGAYALTQKGINISANGTIVNLGNDLANGGRAARINSTTGLNNYVELQGGSTGNAPLIIAQGTDANIDLPLAGKGTGVPKVPTATADANTTQAASTAFVLGQAASANPVIAGTAAPGTSTRYARADHVHPTDTTRAPATRSVSAGTGLTGGGDLSADRTISVAPHFSATGTAPTCSTGCASIRAGSTDLSGEFTATAAATTTTISFGSAFSAAPNCILQPVSNGNIIVAAAPTTTTLVVALNAAAPGGGQRVAYACFGV